jgi:hypothetical protein
MPKWKPKDDLKEEYKTKWCYTCNGIGYITSYCTDCTNGTVTSSCGKCRGVGFRTRRTSHGGGARVLEETFKCTDCDGTGKKTTTCANRCSRGLKRTNCTNCRTG